MTVYDIALMGPLSFDINVEPDGEEVQEVGGAITYSPYAAAASGAKAIAFAKANLNELDVARHFHDFTGTLVAVPAKKTTSIRNVYHDSTHETRSSFVVSQCEAFTAADLNDVKAKIYHLGGLIYGDFDSAFIRDVSKRGQIAVDAQCLLRHADRKSNDLFFEDWADKHALLPLIDYFKVDAKEAEILTASTDRKSAAKLLHQWGAKEVFISYHENMNVFDGKTFYTCAYQAASSEGRTGRGDTVFASYLARRLEHGIAESLLFASGLISLKLACRGPFRGTEQDVIQKIKTDQMHVVKERLAD